jgi:HEAT repeat protein
MDLNEIQEQLQHPDFQYRLKAVQALHHQPSEVAVPILIDQLTDREFLVRTFIAMALAKHQTDRSFQALLEMMKFDDTPSVRAEASNSLSLFGRVSLSHLTAAFIQDDHWLLRRSILAAITDMESPIELLEVCLEGLNGTDQPVQEACIDAMGTLHESPQKSTVMERLIELSAEPDWRKRRQVALALRKFDHPRASHTLQKLRQDPDHRVIAAALEELL